MQKTDFEQKKKVKLEKYNTKKKQVKNLSHFCGKKTQTDSQIRWGLFGMHRL